MRPYLHVTALCLAMFAAATMVAGCGGAAPSDSTTPPTQATAPSAPSVDAKAALENLPKSAPRDQTRYDSEDDPEPAPAADPAGDAPAGEGEMSTEAPTESTVPDAAHSEGETATEPTDAAPAAAGAPIDATTIVGTKWSAGGMTFSFEKDGVLKVNDSIPGTWAIEGSSLTVSALGQDYKADIKGGEITYEGSALERVN